MIYLLKYQVIKNLFENIFWLGFTTIFYYKIILGKILIYLKNKKDLKKYNLLILGILDILILFLIINKYYKK